MNSIQDRALRLIELRAERHKRFAAVSKDWANTGNIYVYADASMSGDALLTLHYDFQKDRASFYLGDSPVRGRDIPLVYRYAEGFDGVLDEIGAKLV